MMMLLILETSEEGKKAGIEVHIGIELQELMRLLELKYNMLKAVVLARCLYLAPDGLPSPLGACR